MIRYQKTFAIAFSAVLLSAGIALAALSLDAAKAQGLIGERADGLVGIVGATTPEVSALVEKTNAGRMKVYNDIAAKNGQPLDQVRAVAGQNMINATPAGQYIMPGGGWQKK